MPSANRESVGHLSPVTEVMVASDSASYMFLLTSWPQGGVARKSPRKRRNCSEM